MFSCEFCKISQNIFFKEAFGRLLHHKHLFLPRSFAFSKAISQIFSVQYFFLINLQAGYKCKINISSPQPEAYFHPSWKKLWKRPQFKFFYNLYLFYIYAFVWILYPLRHALGQLKLTSQIFVKFQSLSRYIYCSLSPINI